MSYSRNFIEKLRRLELPNTPTLIITENLQKQIDYLHMKIGRAEWSGELITREEGSINDPDNWRIYAEDIFLANIGTPGGTEYTVDKAGFKAVDIVEMYEKFPELLEGKKKLHHIHTHHSMGAFFSGIDWDNLEERGVISNYFMMLVVDFEGTYKAKMAFKGIIKPHDREILEFANNLDGYNAIELEERVRPSEVLAIWDMKIEYPEIKYELPEWFTERYKGVKEDIAKEEEERRSTFHFDRHEGRVGYAPGYTHYRDSHSSKVHRSHDDWDYDPASVPDASSYNRRISEMTDREFMDLEDEGDGRFPLTEGDANVILNYALGDSSYRDRTSAMSYVMKWMEDKPTPTALEKKSTKALDKILKIFSAHYPNPTDEQWLHFLSIAREDCSPKKYNAAVEALDKALEEEMDLIIDRIKEENLKISD